MSKRELTKVERYVMAEAANRQTWDSFSKEERAEAEVGLRWLELHGTPYHRTRRGRPPGSRNHKSAEQQPLPEVTQ